MSLRRKIDIQKFPLYSLPKLYGWHLLGKQDISEKGKKYSYFGANWWDLFINEKLQIQKGRAVIFTKNTHDIVVVNLSDGDLRIKNVKNGEIYLVKEKVFLNNIHEKDTIYLESENPETEFYITLIGHLTLVLGGIEHMRDGDFRLGKTEIFRDFLLMSGVPDTEQYLNTVGIESMDCIVTKGFKYIDTENTVKSDFVDTILTHWKSVNPMRRGRINNGITKNIHWIWLRKDITKEEYGPIKPKFYRFMFTWLDRNPDFKTFIWTDNPDFKLPKRFIGKVEIMGPGEINRLLSSLPKDIKRGITYLYKNHKNVGARSDTLRQAILYMKGGFYADINDAVCLSSLQTMAEKFDYIIGFEPVIYVNNAIIGSRKGHQISRGMLAYLSHYSKNFVEEWDTDYIDATMEEKDDYIVSTTGPIALTSVIWGLLKDANLEKFKNTLFLPSSWVYPNYWQSESPNNWLKPMSIFAHYDGREYLKN